MTITRPLVVVCAKQRSGTTALQKTLEKTGLFRNYGEIFHDDHQSYEYNYFNFLASNATMRDFIAYPNDSNMNIIFETYLSYLNNSHSQRYTLLDIKYTSWHHFNYIWHEPLERPVLMRLLAECNTQFIHLVRNNLFACYLSSKYAQKVNKYHYERQNTESFPMPEQFIVNVEEARYHMNLLRSHQILFRDWLSSYPKTIELGYEEVFDQDGLSQNVDRILRETFSLGTADLSTPIRPTPVRMQDVILNAKDVLEYFSGTEFEYMVSDILKFG